MKQIIFAVLCLLILNVVHAQTVMDSAVVQKDLSFFSSPLAVSLKKNFKKRDIENIKTPELKEIARQLLKKKYDTQYRLAEYKAWLNPTALGKKLFIGDGYSKYEGITGIYLPEGKHLILVENIHANKEVRLLVPDWNRRAPEGISPAKDPAGWGIKRQVFPLKNGINIIDLKEYGGLAYVDYYSDEPAKERPVTVHFITGMVNGYFDLAKNNDDDWNNLIDHAVYPVIDAKGKHIQIAYPAEDCKKYAYGRGVELLNRYDSMLYRQYEIMGWVKYNHIPDNHILARVNYNYYMFRDGDGVAYMGVQPGYALRKVIDPDILITGTSWGFNHEIGHVHQLSPYFRWGGMAEVSNNIMSMYVTTSYGNESNLHKNNNYQSAREVIINKHACYLQQKELMDRLVPFWQLYLYFDRYGYKDFYPDLYEAFRKQGDKDMLAQNKLTRNPAYYQLNFVKTACEISKTDLTDFFDKYGFFYVGTFAIKDYSNYVYEMTPEMVDACKKEIAAMNFPKPQIDISTLED